MCSSCVGSSKSTQRNLPPLPDFAKPALVQEERRGDSGITAIGREKAGRLKANRTIEELRGWYENVRRDYAGAVE